MNGKSKWRNNKDMTSREWNLLHRMSTSGHCLWCAPHKHENRTRSRRGARKPRRNFRKGLQNERAAARS